MSSLLRISEFPYKLIAFFWMLTFLSPYCLCWWSSRKGAASCSWSGPKLAVMTLISFTWVLHPLPGAQELYWSSAPVKGWCGSAACQPCPFFSPLRCCWMCGFGSCLLHGVLQKALSISSFDSVLCCSREDPWMDSGLAMLLGAVDGPSCQHP